MSTGKILIFDVDDTLYNQVIPFRNACRSAFDMEVPEEEESWYQAFCRRGQEIFEACERKEISLEESRIYRITHAMEDCGQRITREQADAFQKSYLEQQKRLALSPVMEKILGESKKAGCTLGIITNGPYDHQMGKVRTMGIDRYVPEENIIVSGAAGFSKPDLRIFRLMEERLGHPAEEMWMIGDSYANDMMGAKAAGWNTVWVNYHHREIPQNAADGEDFRPDYTVYTEEELKKLTEHIIE